MNGSRAEIGEETTLWINDILSAYNCEMRLSIMNEIDISDDGWTVNDNEDRIDQQKSGEK